MELVTIKGNYSEALRHKVFGVVRDIVGVTGQPAYVIGGFVRDLLLGIPSQDIDIVVQGSGIDLATSVSRRFTGSHLSVFKSFGTAMVKAGGAEIELVGARKESYRADSRKPIVEDGTIEDDQRRRDFTINALALSLNPDTFGDIVDPFGGIEDLRDGIIRTPLDPDVTFSDDPLRMLRGIRFASRLGFSISPATLEGMKRMAPRIEIISQERITEELMKAMETSREPSVEAAGQSGPPHIHIARAVGPQRGGEEGAFRPQRQFLPHHAGAGQRGRAVGRRVAPLGRTLS